MRGASLSRQLAEEAIRQLPRLTRLEHVQPTTRISAGLLLDEQAGDAPDAVAFLFGDRAHTRAAVKERIDNVVRGLLSLGVRQEEHVGVLMRTRPSALVAVAALNRIGAIAVLLRPDGEPARELALGGCARVIAEPELAGQASDGGASSVLVLGGGAARRKLGARFVDMERIDPAAVPPPAWFRPNPGLAGDLAFVLFTGFGAGTRVNRVSNGRWSRAAFGTASAAALSTSDTVYSVTPIYHPSGLLMSVGGAIAGGARLALAERFDPDTYWAQARRYGATVGSYTWTMLRELVERPPDPGERHHPVRLFIGSGMPRGLWRRVEQRFAPARVLEFYTSAEGEAVLVNVADAKPGAAGRRLPGSAELRIAAYDAARGALLEGADGFAIECAPGEVGMLLAREPAGAAASAVGEGRLQDVFEPDDAWLSTGDLFRRDGDGDHWLVGDVAELIRRGARRRAGAADRRCARRARGRRPRGRLRRARRGGAGEIAVAAVTQRARRARAARCRRDHARAAGARARYSPADRPRRARDPADDVVPADRGAAAQPRPATREPPRLDPRGRRLPDVHGRRSRAAGRRVGVAQSR